MCDIEDETLGPSESKYNCPPDIDKYLCLHKENNNLSFRECKNIKNQQCKK